MRNQIAVKIDFRKHLMRDTIRLFPVSHVHF